jgi:hypothetical protein
MGIFSGIGSSIKGFLNTDTGLGAPISRGFFATAPSGLGFSGEDAGLATIANSEAASGALGGATIGQLLGGAGIGFGAGSLLGQLTPHPTNATIGSGIGAIGGTLLAAGGFLGPLGLVAGGLLGGCMGRVAGLIEGPI